MRILLFLISCGHLFGTEPIDVVFTWVDGSDPLWAAKKELYERQQPDALFWGVRARRFRNRNELKYALRSVHSFAPFVRHIFIVTDNQRPSWLKDHPKVTLVFHKEIFLKKEYLPVFNSEAIEANLHRIPGLSERYVYCNDDFFLGRKASPGDFFTKDGKMKFFEAFEQVPSGLRRAQEKDGYIRSAWNTSQALKRVYGDDKTQYFLRHAPYTMRKSVVKHAEKTFPTLFQKNSASRFRSADAYRIACCLIQYVGLYTDMARPCTCDCYFFPFTDNRSSNSRHMEQLLERRPLFFCVQDEADKAERETEKTLTRFFEAYFPVPAPWEL